MGKKKLRAKYTSKGQRNNSDRALTKTLRREYLESPERLINQQKALQRGKRVIFVEENPNPHETNKRFIRVRGITPQERKKTKENA